MFTSIRVAVFIDGCFWHGCPDHGQRVFRHNIDYWPGKIAANVARDIDTNLKLQAAGWTVLRFWEHEDAVAVAEQVVRVLRIARTEDIGGGGKRP